MHDHRDFTQASPTFARALRHPPNLLERYSRNRAFLSDFQYNVLKYPTSVWSAYLSSLEACIVALPRYVDVNREGLTHGG